jgi:hypothetical protein
MSQGAITDGTNIVVGYFNYNSTETRPLGRDDYVIIMRDSDAKTGCAVAQGMASPMSDIRFKITVNSAGDKMTISGYDDDTTTPGADDQGFFAGVYAKATAP